MNDSKSLKIIPFHPFSSNNKRNYHVRELYNGFSTKRKLANSTHVTAFQKDRSTLGTNFLLVICYISTESSSSLISSFKTSFINSSVTISIPSSISSKSLHSFSLSLSGNVGKFSFGFFKTR